MSSPSLACQKFDVKTNGDNEGLMMIVIVFIMWSSDTRGFKRFQGLFNSWTRSVGWGQEWHQKLAPILMDKQMPDGDWSTSGRLDSCNVAPEVGSLTLGERPTLA